MLSVFSCVYPYTPELKESATSSLVVDADIKIGGRTAVQLSYVNSFVGGSSRSPYGTAYAEDSEGVRYEGRNGGSTIYIDTESAPRDRKYRLVIQVDGYTYSSEWMQPFTPPQVDNVRFEADERNVMVLLSMTEAGEGQGYAAVYFEETWDYHADYAKNYFYDDKSSSVLMLMSPDKTRYYCWIKAEHPGYYLLDYSELGGKVVDMPVYAFSRTSNRNHSKYGIEVKVRNLSPAEYRFRKTLDDNARIGGNLFQPDPGELPSNIICEDDDTRRAYGYVTVSEISSMKAVLDSRYYIPYAEELIILQPEDYGKYYSWGYEPIDDVFSNGEFGVGWGLQRCWDCAKTGGTYGFYPWGEYSSETPKY